MHPDNMSLEELKQRCFAMNWAILDLGQALSFIPFMKKRYWKEAIENACEMAYKSLNILYADKIIDTRADITFVGKKGLKKLSSFYKMNELKIKGK